MVSTEFGPGEYGFMFHILYKSAGVRVVEPVMLDGAEVSPLEYDLVFMGWYFDVQ